MHVIRFYDSKFIWRFSDSGMRHLIGSHWRDLFDVIIVNAKKPKFFTNDNRFHTQHMPCTWCVQSCANMRDFVVLLQTFSSTRCFNSTNVVYTSEGTTSWQCLQRGEQSRFIPLKPTVCFDLHSDCSVHVVWTCTRVVVLSGKRFSVVSTATVASWSRLVFRWSCLHRSCREQILNSCSFVKNNLKLR